MTPARPFQPAEVVRDVATKTAAHADERPPWGRLAWLAREAEPPLDRLERALHPWSSFVVLPIFALANAGIALDAASIDAATETRVGLAVVLGLVVGKTLGLSLGALVAVRLGLCHLPKGVGWVHVVGVAALAGIGFTVSLFIADLAFADPALVSAAKLGILCGSVLAAVLGIALLLLASRRARTAAVPAQPPR